MMPKIIYLPAERLIAGLGAVVQLRMRVVMQSRVIQGLCELTPMILRSTYNI